MSAVYHKRFEAVFLCHHPKGPKWSYAKAAKYMKKDVSFVKKWCKKFSEEKNVDDLPGRGKTRKTSKREDMAILKLFENNPQMTLRRARSQLAKKGINVSLYTIRQRLKENSIKHSSTTSKPLLSERHKENRLKWATGNLNRDWSNIVFTDESSFWAYQGPRRVWLKQEQRHIIRTVKHPIKIHVWGCFCSLGFGKLVVFTGNLNAERMLQIYKKGLLKSTDSWFGAGNRSWVLQEDNDPKHRSRQCTDWKEKEGIHVLEWPSQSPDANPIENVWALMKAKLRLKNVFTLQQLKLAVKNAWKDLPSHYAEKLVKNMDSRCKAVIENNGDFTKY